MHNIGVYLILCKSYCFLPFIIMSFEEELEAIDREEWLAKFDAIDREEWLAKFDDKQVMNAARMFLEWLYHLPDDWQPKEYTEFTF